MIRPASDGDLFGWPMGATTVYGGGRLWLATQAGVVACLDPRTGSARSTEHVRSGRSIDLIAVDPARRRVLALDDSRPGLVEIIPPSRCWT